MRCCFARSSSHLVSSSVVELIGLGIRVSVAPLEHHSLEDQVESRSLKEASESSHLLLQSRLGCDLLPNPLEDDGQYWVNCLFRSTCRIVS